MSCVIVKVLALMVSAEGCTTFSTGLSELWCFMSLACFSFVASCSGISTRLEAVHEGCHMGRCQNYGPLLGPSRIRHLVFRGP